MAAILVWLIGFCLVFSTVLVFQSLVLGYVLSIMWGWFFTPLGLPAIGVINALGIALTVNFLTSRVWGMEAMEKQILGKEKANKEAMKRLGFSLVYPWFALLLGYIAHCWM